MSGPSSTHVKSAMLSSTSSSTAVVFLHSTIATPSVSNTKSTTSNITNHSQSTVLRSSPFSILGAAGAQNVTTTKVPLSRSLATIKASSSNMMSTPSTTSTNPTDSAALADGIALGGALLLFAKNAAQVGPNIVKPPSKTSALKALGTVKADLEDAFKDRGGIDTGTPCVTKRKRDRLRERGLISLVMNAFRCAIKSLNTLQTDLKVDFPDPGVIADDLDVVEESAQDLQKDEENDDDDDDNETATMNNSKSGRTEPTSKILSSTSTSPATRTTKISSKSGRARETSSSASTGPASRNTKSSPTSKRTKTISKTSIPASRSSAGRTSTISSGQLPSATCYTGPEYAFPASSTDPAADSQSVAFKLLGFALSNFFAMDPPAPFTTASPNSTQATKGSLVTSSSGTISEIGQTPQGFLVVPTSRSTPDPISLPSCMGDATSVTDCAHTSQPASGETPSISTIAPQSPTHSSTSTHSSPSTHSSTTVTSSEVKSSTLPHMGGMTTIVTAPPSITPFSPSYVLECTQM
ncbi:hypothetical protein IMSHALPRED_004703 [Imshaugia aleurites]|uniref:Uncharacterized protein n=1 Tax=Imshaugia aleurites TaxID=172621 RepID=A0A8H3FF38_9LECA|nr:hypothetical protein IMSHALPRED_004703 [Imshaugia aleurites]